MNFLQSLNSTCKLTFSRTIIVLGLILISCQGFSQTQDTVLAASKLKTLSLEELMNIDVNIEVTSISMRPEKLSEVPSAVQVITGKDINHSAATRLPEALQLASNLQIARVNSHDWAITARGFNGFPAAGGVLANKLLVMIDGRSIYNPLLGGVFWDVQNTFLKDVDRIEVVSGPGGTLWGENAVNGVINVVTKSSKETQGLYLSGAKGSFLNHLGEVRLGSRSKLDSNLYFRIYAQHFDQESTTLENGNDAKDPWTMAQGGFRMDYYPSSSDILTFQGDIYEGSENKQDRRISHSIMDGQNLLARFTHFFSETSDLKIQAYYDRNNRRTPYTASPFFYTLNTYDIDIHHRFSIGKAQSILYGVHYRLQQDQTASLFVPLNRDMPIYSSFIQDEIIIFPERLKLTIGSKFLHNDFTGFEIQPSARLGYNPNKSNTIWAAISRAVRTPTRFDSDIIISEVKFKSEKVISYELGYRAKALQNLSFSFSTFYNEYTDLRSIDNNPGGTVPIVFANNQRAKSWGFEFSGNYQVSSWVQVRGGYTYFDRNIWSVSPTVLSISEEVESVDPKNVFMVQSIMELPWNFSLDLIGRYVDLLPAGIIATSIPSYFTYDARIAWHWKPFEFSIAGQNLLEKDHIEVGFSKIPRTIYGRITCQF
jgi:iron complex outermembrane recepter protein